MKENIRFVYRAKAGDAAAFSELYREVYRDLYRFAWYALKNSHDAEDVVSDTVMDAWVQIASLRKEEAFRAWIFRILSNKCRQRLKAYRNKEEQLQEELCAPLRDAEEDADVRAAFARLDDEERLILSMNLFGGYTSGEIGEIMSMKPATLRSRQKRALEKMEKYLNV